MAWLVRAGTGARGAPVNPGARGVPVNPAARGVPATRGARGVPAREVLAAAEIARTRRERRRGLMGRADVEGALVLRPCRQVHTLGMRFPLDVAFCDREGRVVSTGRLAPWRLSRPHLRAHFVIEARAGAFDRWRLRPGDQLEVLD